MTFESVINAVNETELRLWHMVAAFLFAQFSGLYIQKGQEHRTEYREVFKDFIDQSVPFELQVRAFVKDLKQNYKEGAIFDSTPFHEGLDKQIISVRKLMIYAKRGQRSRLSSLLRFLIKLKVVAAEPLDGASLEQFIALAKAIVSERDALM